MPEVMEVAERTHDTVNAECHVLEPMDIRIEDRALRDALDNSDVAAVKRFLAAGAAIMTVVEGANAIHRCVYMYDTKVRQYLRPNIDQAKETEIIEAMVAAAKERNVLNCPDGNGQTPLSVAIGCESGNLRSVEALVNAGARVCDLNTLNDSALHVAARSGNCKMLKYFLDNHDIPNSVNNRGEAPIHVAVCTGKVELLELLLEKFGTDKFRWQNNEGSSVWHHIAECNSFDIAQYLFQNMLSLWDLNGVDDLGRTPLYKAACGAYVPMTKLLLRNGATLAVKGEKEAAIKAIASHFNNPLSFFEDLFDECINEDSKQIYIDYKVLVSKDMSQIKVLEDFMRFGLSKILKHPTIESLIYFKWRCLLPVFYTIIVTYVTFLLSLNIFVTTTFNNIDTRNVRCSGTEDALNAEETPLNAAETSCVGCGWLHWTLVVSIYISTGVLIAQEFVWIYLQKLHHFGHPETWLKLSVLILALAVPGFLGCATAPDSMTWQRHVACLALLLAWLQAMLLMSRFPGWGYYVLMLERVAIKILKILATTIFLVVGFSTCLMIQYQSKPPFDGPVAAFTKTLVMMVSEFDYEGLFGEDHDAELKNTKIVVRCLFIIFVIFITIVLMNFMIGVAVSDVNELNDIGNIRRLEKQVQLLSTLEGLGDTVLSKWWRRLRLIRFHRSMHRALTELGRLWNVTDHHRQNKGCCFTETFTSELHNAVLNIAKRKKQSVDKLDAVYDAVVGKRPNDSVSFESSSLATTLNERMKYIEKANKELKQSIDKVQEMIGSRISPMCRCKMFSKSFRKRKIVRRKST